MAITKIDTTGSRNTIELQLTSGVEFWVLRVLRYHYIF